MQEGGVAIVVGANALGEGIAADLANAGWSVHLLDVSMEQLGKSLTRIRTAHPPLLFLPEYVQRIQPALLNELTLCREADWVIEALADTLEIKRRLFLRLELFVGPKTIVSSSTTFLSLKEIVASCDERFRERFLGVHFFSPPRYQKLLEIAPTEETQPGLVAELKQFAEEQLGHRVVITQDTPGFVATRIWVTHMMDALHTAREMGVDIETVDTLTGPYLGRPRGLFRALDLVGLDVFASLATRLHAALPDDPLRERLVLPAVLEALIAERAVGDRVGKGFYQRTANQWLVLDLETRDYRPAVAPRDDIGQAYVSRVLESLFSLVQRLQPQLTSDELSLDQAMEWGYGWTKGPFALEAEYHRHLFAVPSPPPEYLELSHWPILQQTEHGLMRDLGDGIVGFSFRTPQNTLTPETCTALIAAVERAENEFHSLILANEGPHFSSGFARDRWWRAVQQGDFASIEADITLAQDAFLRLQQARVPVVGVVRGFTLGGGAELALHCSTRHASPETYFGLPQVLAGLLPCFGGITALLSQLGDPRATLLAVLGGQISTSAYDAQHTGKLARTDTIGRNADRLLHDARQRALALTETERAELPHELPRGDAVALRAEMGELHERGRITAHELRLAEAVIYVLCDGAMNTGALRHRERDACLALCKEPLSQARLKHLVETGMPLRN